MEGVRNPLAVALKGKGLVAVTRRMRTIGTRYGLTSAKMDQALQLFAEILDRFGCGASFPLTAIVLKHKPSTITKYLDRNIEFTVHGYRHIDYTRLAPEHQLADLRLARQVFEDAGIAVAGFRSPYLRRSASLYSAIEAAGFSYSSNQSIWWDVVDAGALSGSALDGYTRAIDFYDPWYASQRPSLPRLGDKLVEIPVSLPDDEILVDRLGAAKDGLVKHAWQGILSKSYRLGELFTIQLHPERIVACVDGLSAVLTQARTFTPPVWIARLDEIARWWRARTAATVEINDVDHASLHLVVAGPSGTTILARAVQVDVPTRSWAGDFRQVEATSFTVHSSHRPFIGVSPAAPVKLIEFLRQQGYIVEISQERQPYLYYFDQTEFTADQERPLLAYIEETAQPLVRLGRWPNGARSALAITGDIDALTLWNYIPFFSGR